MMTRKFKVSRGYGAERAEVTVKNDGSFFVGERGPFRIEETQKDWIVLTILDVNGKVITSGNLMGGTANFSGKGYEATDGDRYKAAADWLYNCFL